MYANRINSLPPYLFAAIDRARTEAIRKGVDVINLSIGDPDMPTPPHIVEAMKKSIHDPARHRYPSYEGMLSFRTEAARWYKKTMNIDLNPEDEVLTLIGSKEGLAHIPLAFLNPDDISLVPDPAYPVYNIGSILADGKPFRMPLLSENDFLPDLEAIPADVAKEAKLMFLNYPNNPTSATATSGFFEDVVDFANENDILVVHDNAYSEMTYDGYKAPSFLNVSGAKDVGIEVHSLSKTYNMTGWRIGFAVGNRDMIAGLGKVKTNVDSGAFEAVQEAGIAALSGPQDCVREMNRIYKERRDALLMGLKELGLEVKPPRATFYVWAHVSGESQDFAKMLLEKAGIVATPGIGFGESGEGYIRFALTQPVGRINEAVDRMRKLDI
ncbi:LL-diaminopimelate aminotransferase apoenzyme [Candidatus Methanoperedens nitroreducens]|uniref:Aminotransferase n=1 Tax=Candidatus Methanoperedens nitratireducens TaxID=1392998 RepID=A0A062VBC9_9EURY|nr:LL-diaminopimelate aminotransferase [Candidatus Methanoperedens nitroreducens]KCZ72979.1 LL-diaminopimelate aminotransferase apoenzyme [Candidatus Methanoperedens nitroreducens]MDJ1423078.1 LL-diaminopimelate aminotransferase [Candidatus Methanoperedens sp.]